MELIARMESKRYCSLHHLQWKGNILTLCLGFPVDGRLDVGSGFDSIEQLEPSPVAEAGPPKHQ